MEKVNTSSGIATTISTGLSDPWSVALDAAGDVYVSLSGHGDLSIGGTVLMINVSTGVTTTVAGNGGYGYSGDGGSAINATFRYEVNDIAIGPDGSLYIADGGNARGS